MKRLWLVLALLLPLQFGCNNTASTPTDSTPDVNTTSQVDATPATGETAEVVLSVPGMS